MRYGRGKGDRMIARRNVKGNIAVRFRRHRRSIINKTTFITVPTIVIIRIVFFR